MAVSDDLAKVEDALDGVVVPAGSLGIQRIYSIPNKSAVTTAEVPCYLIMPKGDPVITIATFRHERETVTYSIFFLYKPTAQGNLEDNYAEILAYRDPTRDALYASCRLDSTVDWTVTGKCSLPKELPIQWNGAKYIGFETQFQTVNQRAITLTD